MGDEGCVVASSDFLIAFSAACQIVVPISCDVALH